MNDFWSDSPKDNAPFEEHLAYFLKYATVKIHGIYNRTTLWRPEDLSRYLFEREEGYIPDCGIKLISFTDEFELTEDILEMERL